MLIVDRVLQLLAKDGPTTSSHILSALPELANTAQAEQVLRLLLRLDMRLELMSDNRWTIAQTNATPEQRIITTTQSYLSNIPGEGALLNSVVEHVIENTEYDRALILSVISRSFVNNGRLVRNQLR